MNGEIPLDDAGIQDLEQNDGGRFLINHTVQHYSWKGLTVTVKDRETRKARDLINDISGHVQQGLNADGAGLQNERMLTLHKASLWR